MSGPERIKAPVAPTTGNLDCTLGYAAASTYKIGRGTDKPALVARPKPPKEYGHKTRSEARLSRKRPQWPLMTFRDKDGRKWAYRGKKGRVLMMLATGRDGVTQWDTLPWHTRLGGTIHALRRDGLVIDTEREGECRHARYRLMTPGTLFQQGETAMEAVTIHRVKP